MAEKRMFSMQIIDSDAFLDLPLSAQALYFHLGMRADDDGILNNAKMIARSIGSNTKDFDTLVSKKFIIVFDNGISVIKHWHINNYIAKDRYRPTTYTEVKKLLKKKENGAYTTSEEVDRIQIVDNSYTQSSKDKNSIDESREDDIVLSSVGVDKVSDKEPYETQDVYLQRFETFWKAYPKRVGRGNVFKWFKTKKPSEALLNAMLKAISVQKNSEQWQNVQYIPMPMTWLNQERWGDEIPEQPAVVEAKKKVELEKTMEQLLQEEAVKALNKHQQNMPKMSEEEVNKMLNDGVNSIVVGKKFK